MQRPNAKRPLCIPNSNQLIGCWLEIELDRNVRVSTVEERSGREGLKTRVGQKERVARGPGVPTGRRRCGGWLRKRGRGRRLLLPLQCAWNINANHFSLRPLSGSGVNRRSFFRSSFFCICRICTHSVHACVPIFVRPPWYRDPDRGPIRRLL